jgi:hypothetical protein
MAVRWLVARNPTHATDLSFTYKVREYSQFGNQNYWIREIVSRHDLRLEWPDLSVARVATQNGFLALPNNTLSSLNRIFIFGLFYDIARFPLSTSTSLRMFYC